MHPEHCKILLPMSRINYEMLEQNLESEPCEKP